MTGPTFRPGGTYTPENTGKHAAVSGDDMPTITLRFVKCGSCCRPIYLQQLPSTTILCVDCAEKFRVVYARLKNAAK